MQWLPYATIVALTSLVLGCCQLLELPEQGQAALDAACMLLLAVTLLACLLLTHQTVDSWNRRRILASTPPWEVVVQEERTALARSAGPRCDPLLAAVMACVASQVEVRMPHCRLVSQPMPAHACGAQDTNPAAGTACGARRGCRGATGHGSSICSCRQGEPGHHLRFPAGTSMQRRCIDPHNVSDARLTFLTALLGRPHRQSSAQSYSCGRSVVFRPSP